MTSFVRTGGLIGVSGAKKFIFLGGEGETMALPPLVKFITVFERQNADGVAGTALDRPIKRLYADVVPSGLLKVGQDELRKRGVRMDGVDDVILARGIPGVIVSVGTSRRTIFDVESLDIVPTVVERQPSHVHGARTERGGR